MATQKDEAYIRMIKFALINEKGGSGKTTLTVNLASYFAIYKKLNVLIIDMDPQGQSGKSLGLNVRDLPITIYDILTGQADIKESIQNTKIEKLKIIPSNKKLVNFSSYVLDAPDKDTRLRQALKKLKGFDFVFIDSPPSLGLISFNVMTAANKIIVPVSLNYLALDGTAEIIDTVNRLKKANHLRDIEFFMLIPTMYRRTRLAAEIIETLRKHFPELVSTTKISMDVKIDEAQSRGLTIWEYAPKSRGAEMIKTVAEEIWEKISNSKNLKK